MSCQKNSEYMMKYFDKQANDIETAYLNKHIKTCGKCRVEFENLSGILSNIETGVDLEPPSDFEAQVMAKVRQVKEQKAVKEDKLLIFLYGLTTVLLLIVVAGMISGLKEISIINLIKESYSIRSLTDIRILSPEFFYNTGIAFYTFAKNTLVFLYELTVMFMTSYSYIFGLSLAVLLMLQRLYVNLLGQASGREVK